MFQENIALNQYSNYKIGGPARYFAAVKTAEEVITAAAEARRLSAPIFVLGGGTNLLISDAGFPGLVMRAEFNALFLEAENRVRVGSGVLMKELVQFCIDNSLSGMEWAGGLPGTVGGAVWGNAGAFKGEMKDSLIATESVDITVEPKKITRTNPECQFGYRNSIFKMNAARGVTEVITELVFQFASGDQKAIAVSTQEKIDYRIAKQPLDYPNIGSIFKNTEISKVPAETLKRFEAKIKNDPFPVLPTAVLNDAAGLKGRTVGGAMVSPKHPNFIINSTGSATAADVKALMEIVRAEIKKQFGVELEQEVIEV
jgi:UDP-N-acetylmuramate dehydrogenase